MSESAHIYLTLLGVLATGVAFAVLLILPWRRRSYRTWPPVIRAAWLIALSLFVALGLFGVSGLALTEIRERRVGLGTGFFAAVIFGTIKGVVIASRRSE